MRSGRTFKEWGSPVSSAHDRLVAAGLLLAESAWIYALGGLIGVAFGGQGSPLGWLAVLAVMSTAFLTSRVLQLIGGPDARAYLVQMTAGVIVLYLVIASQVTQSFGGLDMGWLAGVVSDNRPPGYALRAFSASVVGAVLWWRGVRLTSADDLAESLATSFKLGVMALAVAGVVDIFHPADLGVFPMMFLFFGASIIGLSVGHLMPATRQTSERETWGRVIGGLVAGVVVVGLLFSLLRGSALTLLATPVTFVLNAIASILFYLVIVPVAFLANLVVQLLFWTFGRFANPENAPELIDPEGPLVGVLEELQYREGGSTLVDSVLEVTLWVFVGVVTLIVLVVLARAFRRRPRLLFRDDLGIRESVRHEADPAYDLAKLFFNLLPSGLKRRRRQPYFRLPDDDPDIVDVFRAYFQMLSLAEASGRPRSPSSTPHEYAESLESVFPADLVRSVTEAFTRACYGHHPAPRPAIDLMMASVEAITLGTGRRG